MPKVARLIIERSAGHQPHSGKRAQTHAGTTPLSFGGLVEKSGGRVLFCMAPSPPSFSSHFPLGPWKLLLTQPQDKLSPGCRTHLRAASPRPGEVQRGRGICRVYKVLKQTGDKPGDLPEELNLLTWQEKWFRKFFNISSGQCS